MWIKPTLSHMWKNDKNSTFFYFLFLFLPPFNHDGKTDKLAQPFFVLPPQKNKSMYLNLSSTVENTCIHCITWKSTNKRQIARKNIKSMQNSWPGPGGRSLIEIQHISGANIQISKKGTFAPGTRNRIVTITGAPQAINTAHFLIEQRINEEETKRACQTKVANATAATATAGVLQ